MKDNTQWGLDLIAQKKKEKQEKIKKAKAQLIEGKAVFDLLELKKYWTYRFEKSLSEEQLADDMAQIEDDYYLAGERFMSMEEYGKYLMEMELYR